MKTASKYRLSGGKEHESNLALVMGLSNANHDALPINKPVDQIFQIFLLAGYFLWRDIIVYSELCQ